MTKNEALLIGIDALENAENIIFSEWGGNCDEYQDAIKIMKEALAKQEQQVVSLQCAHCQVTIDTLNDKVMSLLAKQEQGEPVMTVRIWRDKHGDQTAEFRNWHTLPDGEHSLYTTPQPAQKPLTDEQIQNVMTKAVRAKEVSWLGYKEDEFGKYTIPILSPYHFQIVRAIESAHGIKENT